MREITGDGELPLETVGQDLRAARLRRGDDLATVSKALKIRKDHLEALEEDTLDKLPGKTYAIGFVRSYAHYLGLDAAALVERFKQEISGRTETSVLQPPTTVHEEEPRRLPQGWRLIGLAVVGLLVWGAWHLLSADRETSQGHAAAAGDGPARRSRLQRPSRRRYNRRRRPARRSTPPASPRAAPPLRPRPPPRPRRNRPRFPRRPRAPRRQDLRSRPSGRVYGEQNRDARVVLRARAPTHILVKGRDGTIFINRDLNPGDTYNVRNVTGLVLSTSNGGGVEIDLDGLAMGNAGAQMQPADNLLLDPQSIVDHFNSHRPG